MIVENTQTQMRKGILEYCILSIIARGEIYTSDIMEELRVARLLVVEGTLYPLLTRLKNNKLLDYKWVESVSGPPRKYYVLSEEGRRVLDLLDGTWTELNYAVMTIRADHHSPETQPEPTSEQADDLNTDPKTKNDE